MTIIQKSKREIKRVQRQCTKICQKTLQNIRKKLHLKTLQRKYNANKKIQISLFISRPGMWCFHYLYNLLSNDVHFDVKVIVMPDPVQEAVLQDLLNAVILELQSVGVKSSDIICGWDYRSNKPIDFKKIVNPDILLYTDFWKPHFFDEFYITKFLDKVTILNGYGYPLVDDKYSTFELNILVDVFLQPTEIHKNTLKEAMPNKGKNLFVVGSPKLDVLFDENYIPKESWKQQKTRKKKIIFAPHHQWVGAPDQYQFDSFLKIYDFMIDIAQKYEDIIQIAFRPHPMMKSKLIDQWGKKMADEYYLKWENLENGQYSIGSFVDLFMQSDAMITDSVGFLAEYTAFDKPIFHCLTSTSRPLFNQFGNELCKIFYKPLGLKDGDLEFGIEKFIQNVVIGENDILKNDRNLFVKKHFGRYKNKTASENIYDIIIKIIRNGEICLK